jgi:hypothetical protein
MQNNNIKTGVLCPSCGYELTVFRRQDGTYSAYCASGDCVCIEANIESTETEPQLAADALVVRTLATCPVCTMNCNDK